MLYFDKQGFHVNQNETNTRCPVIESERNKIFQELMSHNGEDNLYGEWQIVPDSKGYPIVKYVERDVEELKGILRRLRTNRVFPIINRSQFWFNSLTQQQKDELQVWYQEWLDVTETLTIPTRPTWLE